MAGKHSRLYYRRKTVPTTTFFYYRRLNLISRGLILVEEQKNMKKQLFSAICGVLLAGTLAVGAQAAGAQIVVRIGPPPPRPVEVVPAPPRPGWVWQAGYHRWDGGRYVWVPGHYAEPPHPGARWAEGHWDHRGGGYVWADGHWR
jgi:hypothetical protein